MSALHLSEELEEVVYHLNRASMLLQRERGGKKEAEKLDQMERRVRQRWYRTLRKVEENHT